MQAGRALIDERYPDYTAAVRAFLADPEAARARSRIAAAFARSGRVRPRALFVISTKTGGTPQTNADLMTALEDRYEPWLLRCDAQTIELSRVEERRQEIVERVALGQPLRAFPHTSPDYDEVVRRMLVRYAFELVHVRHIAWHSLSLPRLCKELGLPVVFSFHDYYAVCPTVKLLDERLDYCGGTCTLGAGECQHELWREKEFPPLKHRAIHDWKRMMAEMLSHCDAFVTTSPHAKDVIARVYPQVADKPFPVIEHGRDIGAAQLAAEPAPGETLRVLVPGNIGVPKGSLVLQGLDRLDRARARAGSKRRYEFHILGNTNIAERGGMVFHGPYEREGFAGHAARIRPHFGMILSIWPETYCHTLTELWSCGVPVIAFDFGAVGERIRAHGGGWLVSGASDADRDPAAVLAALDRVAAASDRADRIADILRWQEEAGAEATTRRMADAYADTYRGLRDGAFRQAALPIGTAGING